MSGKNTNIVIKRLVAVFLITALFFIASCSNNSNYSGKPTKGHCHCSAVNLLKNPSFEDSTETSAAFWTKGIGRWYSDPQAYQAGHHEDKVFVAGNAHSGEKCLAITGTPAGMTRWFTGDVYLEKGAKYHFSCWIKTAWPDMSGQILIPGVGVDIYLEDTTTWTLVEKCFVASKTGSEAVFLMGHGLGTAFNGTGTIYFDDISIKKIK